MTLPRIADAIAAFLIAGENRGLAKRTTETRRNSLAQFAAWCQDRNLQQVAELDSATCLAFQRWLHGTQSKHGTPYSLAAQAGKLSDLRAFGRWLVENGHRQDDPTNAVESPGLPARLPPLILNRQQIATLLEKPDHGTCLGLRDRAILETCYAVGLNSRELAAATIPDFDTQSGRLRVRPVERGRERVVPLGERASEWLGNYLQNARPDLAAGGQRSGVTWAKPRKVAQEVRQTDALFLSQWGEAMAGGDLCHIIGKYLKTIHLPGSRPASLLRDTMAVHALEDGLDLRFLAALLGHADLQSVRKYAAMDMRHLRAVHARFHPAEQPKP